MDRGCSRRTSSVRSHGRPRSDLIRPRVTWGWNAVSSGRYPALRRGADDGLAQRHERAEVGGGDPRPEHARPRRAREGAEALHLQLEPAERLGGRGHRQAELVEVAVVHVAQERQRDVEGLAALSTHRQPGISGASAACQRASCRPSGSGIGIAMKVRVVSRIVVIRRSGGAPPGKSSHGGAVQLRIEPAPEHLAQGFVVLAGRHRPRGTAEADWSRRSAPACWRPGPARRGRNRRSGIPGSHCPSGDTPAAAARSGPAVSRTWTDWFVSDRPHGHPRIGVDDDHVLHEPVAFVDDLDARLGALPPADGDLDRHQQGGEDHQGDDPASSRHGALGVGVLMAEPASRSYIASISGAAPKFSR